MAVLAYALAYIGPGQYLGALCNMAVQHAEVATVEVALLHPGCRFLNHCYRSRQELAHPLS